MKNNQLLIIKKKNTLKMKVMTIVLNGQELLQFLFFIK